jgi:DNA-binding transcriptional regulator YdaS (Cro superfamily)
LRNYNTRCRLQLVKHNLKRDSEGAVQLKAYFAPPPRQMTQTQLANALGITPQAVSNWVNGGARPPAAQREAIERITGISADAWLFESERKEIEASVKAAGNQRRAAGAR